jgi:isocitrate dehydrogenase (NAD+)
VAKAFGGKRRVVWYEVLAGEKAKNLVGEWLPNDTLEAVKAYKVAIKGPLTTPVGGGIRSLNVTLRQVLDLYACVRPVRYFDGTPAPVKRPDKMDVVIFRENTEDVYSGLEHEIVPDVMQSLKIITRRASIRIAEAAFQYALKHSRKKVTAVHKANIMKLSDGLFLRCCREVAQKYPDVEYRELIVDNAAMQLVIRPETFDILLLPNLYGDIVSDLAAGLVGGLGLAPGANIGDDHAVFEAVHGSAPDIAGKGLANPTALMLSSVGMLNHIGQLDAAARLQEAIENVYAEGKHVPKDVGGTAGTAEFTEAVCGAIRDGRCEST